MINLFQKSVSLSSHFKVASQGQLSLAYIKTIGFLQIVLMAMADVSFSHRRRYTVDFYSTAGESKIRVEDTLYIRIRLGRKLLILAYRSNFLRYAKANVLTRHAEWVYRHPAPHHECNISVL